MLNSAIKFIIELNGGEIESVLFKDSLIVEKLLIVIKNQIYDFNETDLDAIFMVYRSYEQLKSR